MSIENTSKMSKDNPSLMLGLLMGGASRGIEAMEADGQRQFVDSCQIPTAMRNCDDASLTALGFVLGPVTPDDPMFREATLPKGWRKLPTDHSMWSKIVDETGTERFEVFYKAAFYDRSAFIRPS